MGVALGSTASRDRDWHRTPRERRAKTSVTVSSQSLLLAGLCWLLPMGSSWALEQARLRSPLAALEQRQGSHAPRWSAECRAWIEIPHKVTSVAYYTDSRASVVDEALLARYLELRKAISEEEDYLASLNTRYFLADAVARGEIGRCLASHVLRFAVSDAFTGTDDRRGGGEVRFYSVTPLFSYLIVRDSGYLEPSEDELIRNWIARLMDRLKWLESEFRYENNIEDWTAATFALGAVALNRHELLERAAAVVERKGRMVDSRGLLPLEMARGRMAVEYSLSAAQALSLVIAVAEANGREIVRGASGSGILRMMRRLVGIIRDPQSFLQFGGSREAIARERFDRQNMGWLAIYYRRTGDEDALEAICEDTSLYSWHCGGDWFVFFGSSVTCSPGR